MARYKAHNFRRRLVCVHVQRLRPKVVALVSTLNFLNVVALMVDQVCTLQAEIEHLGIAFMVRDHDG